MPNLCNLTQSKIRSLQTESRLWLFFFFYDKSYSPDLTPQSCSSTHLFQSSASQWLTDSIYGSSWLSLRSVRLDATLHACRCCPTFFPAKQPMKWDDESDDAAEGFNCFHSGENKLGDRECAHNHFPSVCCVWRSAVATRSPRRRLRRSRECCCCRMFSSSTRSLVT